MSLVVKEPKRYNSNPLPNQNTIVINGRQSAFMGNKNSCQIDNNPVRNKRFRNTFEPLINEANHVDSEPHVEPIDIYLSGLLARRQNAWSQDGGNMRVIANGVNR